MPEGQFEIDIKKYKRTVTLMDDDFMSLCLNECIPCTQVMINIILGRSDIHVKKVETQRFFQGFERSLKVDVFAEDESGKLYNIEVQNSDEGTDPRRARFHGAVIDAHSLKKGQKFKELPETYIIFITRNDVFGFGDMLYRIERHIEGRNERFDDGQHIIYVNTSAAEDGSSLWKLIHDMKCDDPNEMFIPEIAERTSFFIETQKGEMNMNAYLAEVVEAREKAAELRRARNIVLSLLEVGKMTLEEIARCSGLAIAEVRRLASGRE